jgi:predicted dinucleotide-binding enzyme
MFKIAIIGTGNVGGALAQQLIKAGHLVLLGARLPLSDKSISLATKIGMDHFGSVENAVRESEIVIFTTPPDASLEIISDIGDLGNKTIIDATNSFRIKPEPYPTVFHAIKSITGNQKVVKCFNTTGYENMLNPNFNGQVIDMFCAGNDLESKSIATQLALEIGFANCYDFGGDDKVELLEKLALSWINLAIMQGMGRNIAFKVIQR